jgi:uncharacterized membrane protein YhhN
LLLALALGLDDRYADLLFAGLLLAALGDVLLIFPSSRTFLAGLIAFLLGHLAYVLAFATAGQPALWAIPLALVAAFLLLCWLWPFFRAWRVPVMAYLAVISLMLVFGLGVGLPEVKLGAVLFYLSDIFVARQRFVRSDSLNPLIGLPLYYLGQYLLAFSLGSGLWSPV